jgi:hypothetical protein
VYSYFTVPAFACDLPDQISLLNTLCLSLKSVFSDENFIDIACECVTAPASNATSALASGRRQLSTSTAIITLQTSICKETLPKQGLVSKNLDCERRSEMRDCRKKTCYYDSDGNLINKGESGRCEWVVSDYGARFCQDSPSPPPPPRPPPSPPPPPPPRPPLKRVNLQKDCAVLLPHSRYVSANVDCEDRNYEDCLKKVCHYDESRTLDSEELEGCEWVVTNYGGDEFCRDSFTPPPPSQKPPSDQRGPE